MTNPFLLDILILALLLLLCVVFSIIGSRLVHHHDRLIDLREEFRRLERKFRDAT